MNFVSLVSLVVAVSGSPVAQSADGVFNSKGVKIRYVTEGAGEAVVLIHGWMSDMTMWGKKLSPLEGFQLIALDCRGHGQSDKPHDARKYGAEMAADIIRLMNHLKVKKAHLVGYSMGAFIAGKVAATQPKRVRSVIYGGQAPLLIGEAGSKEIDVFAKAVEDGQGLAPYFQFVRPELSPAAAAGLAKVAFEGKDVKAFALAGKSFRGLEVTAADLKKSAAPTLFIHGSKESDSTQARVTALHRSLPGSELKVLPNADHVTTLGNPAFGAGVVEFLRKNRGR